VVFDNNKKNGNVLFAFLAMFIGVLATAQVFDPQNVLIRNVHLVVADEIAGTGFELTTFGLLALRVARIEPSTRDLAGIA